LHLIKMWLESRNKGAAGVDGGRAGSLRQCQADMFALITSTIFIGIGLSEVYSAMTWTETSHVGEHDESRSQPQPPDHTFHPRSSVTTGSSSVLLQAHLTAISIGSSRAPGLSVRLRLTETLMPARATELKGR
jgi:hypothetical protein